MHEHLNFLVLGFSSFFSLMNPLGAAFVFSAMTEGQSAELKGRIARRVAIVTLVTLITFALVGEFIFSFFGLTVHGFRIAGGVLFFGMGLELLKAKESAYKGEALRPEAVEEMGITPLGIPMVCGPGAITNAMILTRDAPGVGGKLILLTVVVFMSALVFIALVGADRIVSRLGSNGISVAKRIMGLIVMVVAVEMLHAGLRPLLMAMFRDALSGAGG